MTRDEYRAAFADLAASCGLVRQGTYDRYTLPGGGLLQLDLVGVAVDRWRGYYVARWRFEATQAAVATLWRLSVEAAKLPEQFGWRDETPVTALPVRNPRGFGSGAADDSKGT